MQYVITKMFKKITKNEIDFPDLRLKVDFLSVNFFLTWSLILNYLIMPTIALNYALENMCRNRDHPFLDFAIF